ncbi:MAG: ABC transporter permease, partial [Wenzhouxiangella sp.]
AFVFPRLHALAKVPPAAALTGSFAIRPRIAGTVLAATICGGLLLWLLSDNAQLTGILGSAVIIIVTAAWILGWLIGTLAGQTYRFTQGWLRVALRSLGRSAGRQAVPMATIALAVMTFLSTTMLRDGLLDTYHEQRFTHDGNYLFSGLPGTAMQPFREFVAARDLDLRGLYPSVRARLTAINDIPIEKALDRESDTREEARSPVRLSYAEATPANNTLHEGRWPASGSGSVSVDAEVMSDMGLEIGDTLTFAVGDVKLRATISSRRGYIGGGSSFMFWFMFAPDALEALPQEYLGGFHLAGDSRATLAALSAAFPNVVVTELEQHLSRVRVMMSAITRTMNALIGLLLLAAAMVLAATAVVAADDKRRAGGLLRAIGASSGQIRRMWLVERAMVGFASALIGVLGAHVVAELVFRHQFGMSYAMDWLNYIIVPLAFAGAFAMLEHIFSNRSLRRPPLQAIQHA